jgi:hypothetical protein
MACIGCLLTHPCVPGTAVGLHPLEHAEPAHCCKLQATAMLLVVGLDLWLHWWAGAHPCSAHMSSPLLLLLFVDVVSSFVLCFSGCLGVKITQIFIV